MTLGVTKGPFAASASKLAYGALLGGAFLGAYAPMFRELIEGPWKTEQEGHGPLIIAASGWLIWQSRSALRAVDEAPDRFLGWTVILIGCFLMFVSRTQEVLGADVLSAGVCIVGCVLLLAGRPTLRVIRFPLFFLLFAVPIPDWVIDAATLPLKVFISDAVTWTLYSAGYPIAQNGVMIMIGTYAVLVKDACSGMNSIFALSAIGVFYAHVIRGHSKFRSAALLIATIPIAIIANFIRVLALVLLTYYWGVDELEGSLHGLTGIGLFGIAILIFYLYDRLLGFAGSARRLIG